MTAGAEAHPGRSARYDIDPLGRPRRWRRRLVRALVVLASVLAFFSVFAIWVERQALNTDDWVNTSGELIENSTIRTAVANYLVDQLYANVNVKKEVDKVLPSGVHQLAGPASAGLRQIAGAGAEKILQTSTAQSLWQTANRDAHEQLLAVLGGGNETVSTENGDVTLQLGSLVNNLISQIGIGGNISLPPDAGQITILHSDQLSTAQDIAEGIRGLSVVLVLLTLGTLGLAIYLSRGVRWLTILYGGVGFLVAGFAVIVARHVVGGIIVNQLVSDQSVKPAADATWSIGTSLMISIATTVIILGVFFIIAGWLGSPAISSRRAREYLAPLLQRHVGYVYGALAFVFGLYFLVGPTQNLRSFLTTLVLGAMAAVGIHELRRQTAVEFPLALEADPFGRARDRMVEAGRSLGEGARRLKVPEGARELLIGKGLSDRLADRRNAGDGDSEPREETVAQPPEGANGLPAITQAADQETRIAHLERLADLRDRGVLSAAEFDTEKQRVLGTESPTEELDQG
jgi:hypothetical protein